MINNHLTKKKKSVSVARGGGAMLFCLIVIIIGYCYLEMDSSFDYDDSQFSFRSGLLQERLKDAPQRRERASSRSGSYRGPAIMPEREEQNKHFKHTLRNGKSLKPNCFDFPNKPFSVTNHVKICEPKSGCADKEVGVKTGAKAPEFALVERDSGKMVSLYRDLLPHGKPVLIQLGSYTCPIYQMNKKQTHALAKKYAESITTVIIYVVDAHPGHGEPAPYNGVPWTFDQSTLPQPKTFQERMENAANLHVPGDVRLLVDNMSPLDTNLNNIIWCTWGPVRKHFLIFFYVGIFFDLRFLLLFRHRMQHS